jgi:hypothetical protein
MLRYIKEQIAKMKRFRLIGVALLALFSLGLVAASAQAETAPSFTIQGTRLGAGQSHAFDAKVFNGHSFELKTEVTGIVIVCTGLGTTGGRLLGSATGNPGKDDEVTVFTGCALTAGNGFPNC